MITTSSVPQADLLAGLESRDIMSGYHLQHQVALRVLHYLRDTRKHFDWISTRDVADGLADGTTPAMIGRAAARFPSLLMSGGDNVSCICLKPQDGGRPSALLTSKSGPAIWRKHD